MQCAEATTFDEGEKVLCYHHGLLYEAKVLKLDTDKGAGPSQVQYFVHYNGWKKTWDEWVPESQLLKINEENREKQRELRARAGSSGAGGGTPTNSDSNVLAPPTPESASFHHHSASPSNTPASKTSSRRAKAQAEEQASALDLQMNNGASRNSKSSAFGGSQKENSNANCDSNSNKRGNQFQNASSKRVGSSKGGGGGSGGCNSHQKTPLAPSSTSSVVIVGGTSTRPIIAGANGSGGTVRGRGAQKLGDDSRDGPNKRQRLELPIVIPEPLKRVLVEDWDLVSRQTHLVVIPASVNVERVLNEYLKHREARPDPCIRSEFAASLKEYFNIMLGPQLLYRFERNQFNALEESRRRSSSGSGSGSSGFYPSRYYGAVHLLRLFVKLGTVLSYTPLSQEERRMLLDVSHDFLEFLVEQRSQYFQLRALLERAPKGYADAASRNGVVLD